MPIDGCCKKGTEGWTYLNCPNWLVVLVHNDKRVEPLV